MRKELFISLVSHILVVFFLAFFAPVKAYYQIKGYPKIYNVGLVSFPAGGVGGGGRSGETVSGKTAQAEGIGLKEIKTKKKTTTKKPQKEKKPSKKLTTTASKKKVENKTGTGREGAGGISEIVLGGGLGSARVEGGDFGSPYYLNIAFGRIREAFTNPLRQTNLPVRAAIYFKIVKSGKIVDPIIESSSGISAFDQAALRAVFSSDPLPPLPREYRGEWLGIHLEFEFLP